MSFNVPENVPPMPLDFAKIWEKCEWLTPKEFGGVVILLGELWSSPGFRIRMDRAKLKRLFSNGVNPEYVFKDHEIDNIICAFFWYHEREGFIYSRYILELVGRPTKREGIPNWMRRAVLSEAEYDGGYVCAYCSTRPLELAEVHLDHRLPISRGGINHPQNLAVCCARCNMSKGAMNDVDFQDMIFNQAYQEWEAGA